MPASGVFPPFDSLSFPHFVSNLILSIRHIRFRFILKWKGGRAGRAASVGFRSQCKSRHVLFTAALAFDATAWPDKIRFLSTVAHSPAAINPAFPANNFYHTENKYADSESFVKIARLGAAIAAAEHWRREKRQTLFWHIQEKLIFETDIAEAQWKILNGNRSCSINFNQSSATCCRGQMITGESERERDRGIHRNFIFVRSGRPSARIHSNGKFN